MRQVNLLHATENLVQKTMMETSLHRCQSLFALYYLSQFYHHQQQNHRILMAYVIQNKISSTNQIQDKPNATVSIDFPLNLQRRPFPQIHIWDETIAGKIHIQPLKCHHRARYKYKIKPHRKAFWAVWTTSVMVRNNYVV